MIEKVRTRLSGLLETKKHALSPRELIKIALSSSQPVVYDEFGFPSIRDTLISWKEQDERISSFTASLHENSPGSEISFIALCEEMMIRTEAGYSTNFESRIIDGGAMFSIYEKGQLNVLRDVRMSRLEALLEILASSEYEKFSTTKDFYEVFSRGKKALAQGGVHDKTTGEYESSEHEHMAYMKEPGWSEEISDALLLATLGLREKRARNALYNAPETTKEKVQNKTSNLI